MAEVPGPRAGHPHSHEGGHAQSQEAGHRPPHEAGRLPLLEAGHPPREAGNPPSYLDERARLLQRMRRIEGQVRGISRMIEQGRYCVDILVQIAAVRSALDRVGMSLLRSHTSHCVTEAVRAGDGQAQIDELMDVFERFLG